MDNQTDTPSDPSSASQKASVAIDRTHALNKTDDPSSKPPINPKLPPISEARRHFSLTEHALQDPSLALEEIKKEASSSSSSSSSSSKEKEKTYLYLAYGSNLAASTFQGVRGIRPLAALNVVVPELVMTFDLPGFPYSEPCFANTAYRHPTHPTPHSPPTSSSSEEKTPLLPTKPHLTRNPHWPKGLVGVVYEVTARDFAHILATEGGGAAYQDVLVTCHALPPSLPTIPTVPSTPSFKAHTLYAPPPSSPPSQQNPNPGGGHYHRRQPGYAQPSLRYLNLLRTGAEEHSIPLEYRKYLGELQPYTITTRGQRMGKVVLAMTWRPVIGALFALSRRVSDGEGRNPGWLSGLLGKVFAGVWTMYDLWMKKAFGDGERTIEEGGEGVV